MAQSRKEILLAFLESDPDDTFTRYALGLEHLSEGDAAGALQVFEEVRRRDPSYVALYYQLGKACEALGELDRAREAFTEGMGVARAAADWHTHDELQMALDDLG